jgi:hypothetical protein
MNQNTQIRIRTSKNIDTAVAGRSVPIKPKSLMNLNTQHDQLTGKHTLCASTLNSTHLAKVVRVHAGRKELKK